MLNTHLLVDANEELQKATRLDDITAEAKANERFHFGIYRAAHSAELLRIIEHLWLQMVPYLQWLLRHGEWPKHQRHRAAFHHHKESLEALQEHNAAQAEKALRADLMTASDIAFDFGAAIAAANGPLERFRPRGRVPATPTIDFVLQLSS